MRFLLFLVLVPLGALAWGALFPRHDWQDRLAMGFDMGAAITLASLVPLVRHTDAPAMRRHAKANDAGRRLMLLLTSVLTLAVMAAITGELAGARTGHPLAILKLIGTLVLIWLFANSIYALHYAHEFYRQKDQGDGTTHDTKGIDFPGTEMPCYTDFGYFAFTLGMTFQTSDVAITSPRIRRVVVCHCFAAFIFNIGIIAFTINALGGAG